MELQLIQKKIFEIRGQRVMFDFHLGELYGIETRVLNQAVKRNLKRFPFDFMFQLSAEEYKSLRHQIEASITEKNGKNNSSQIVMSSPKNRGEKYLPYAFTEHGITMLSSVLKSETAINVNIAIVRSFILLKQYHNNFELLNKRIEELEAKFNTKIENINEVINFLLTQPELIVAEKKTAEKAERNPIGFKTKK